MFVRATDKFKDYYQTLLPRLDPNDTVMIYSMWKEYINYGTKYAIPRYVEFVSMFHNIEKLHTSGHASVGFLTEVCNRVNPAYGIIPIHKDSSSSYSDLPIDEHLKHKIVTESMVLDDLELIIK